MRSTVFFAALVASVAAQLRIETPIPLIECQPARVMWAGGTAPYFIAVIPGGQASAAALKTFPQTSDTSLTWTVDLATPQEVTMRVTDSTGAINYSEKVAIQAGSSKTCINTNVVVGGASGAAAASGPAASGASASGASVAGGASASATGVRASASSVSAAASSTMSSAAASASGMVSSARASVSSVSSAAGSAASSVSGATTSRASGAATASSAAAYLSTEPKIVGGILGLVAGVFGVLAI